VSSLTKAPGDKVTLDILANSQPVALKWEVVFPAQLMAMEGDAPDRQRSNELGQIATTHRAEAVLLFLCSVRWAESDRKWPDCNLPLQDPDHCGSGNDYPQDRKRVATRADSKVAPLNDTEAIVIIRTNQAQLVKPVLDDSLAH
jgi:hypothetical protein